MRYLVRASLLAVALSAASTVSVAQSFNKSYDKFKDETVVLTEPMKVDKGCTRTRCDLIVAYTYKGQSPAPPEMIAFQFTFDSTTGDYQESRDLIVLADGARINLGETQRNAEVKQMTIKLYESVPGSTITFLRETLTAQVPYEALMRIAGAKQVEMKIGEMVLPPLSEENLKRIREIAASIIPPPKPELPKPAPKAASPQTSNPPRRPTRRRP
jgi:hypothetical protein